jgi:hypothetical protein
MCGASSKGCALPEMPAWRFLKGRALTHEYQSHATKIHQVRECRPADCRRAEDCGYKCNHLLETAIAKVSYNSGDVNFTREIFVSPVDQVIVVHLRCDHPKKISFFVNLQIPQKAEVTAAGSDTLVMNGENGESSARYAMPTML